MRFDEFRRLAETWGADISRWPEGVRADAAAAARRPECAAILAEQEQLDRLLSDAAPRITDERVERAIHGVVTRLAQAQAPARSRSAFAELARRWFVPAMGFAAAALIGALIGAVEPIGVDEDDARTMLSMILDAEPYPQDVAQ